MRSFTALARSLAIAFMLFAALNVHARLLDDFVHEDGAISINRKGDFVDPYFAHKSLIIAIEAGLDVNELTARWLRWIDTRQRPDGGFDRYCGHANQWKACKPADADDSSVAGLLQLDALYQKTFQPAVSPLSGATRKKAAELLNRLRMPNGLYRIFENDKTAYLMDNAEVYHSLVATGNLAQAKQLKLAIERNFFQRNQWLPSMQSILQSGFYPYALAPAYRWHTGLSSKLNIENEFTAWTKLWGVGWIKRQYDPYPWGLVAWGAREVSNQHWLRCWRHMNKVNASDANWTVIDHAVDQSLQHLGVEAIAQSCQLVLEASGS